MDVTTNNVFCDISPSSSVNIVQSTSIQDGVGDRMTVYLESKKDALSAVKLDPAVLEAQVTINTQTQAFDGETFDHGKADKCEKASAATTKENARSRPTIDFKTMIRQQEAALLSLTPQKLDLLMNFADTMRRQRNITQKIMECSFCKNNGESMDWYSSHCLKDSRGRVKCPVLRAFKCPLCAATGDRAHTIKYCPENAILDADYWSQGGCPYQ